MTKGHPVLDTLRCFLIVSIVMLLTSTLTLMRITNTQLAPPKHNKSIEKKLVVSKRQKKNHSRSQIITPPYRIVQLGEARSGSTFQFILLEAILNLKSPPGIEVETTFTKNETLILERISQNKSFAFKFHKDTESLKQLSKEGKIHVFSSGKKGDYSLYNQNRTKLVECSICEVDQYQRFFDLTDDDISLLKKYMDLYGKIRKCCGLQMSKYQILRLNGCNVSMYVDKPDYPNCENENMTDIEQQFSEMPIPYHAASPTKDWSKPGDCAAYDSIIASGKGFNGNPFLGCKRTTKSFLFKNEIQDKKSNIEKNKSAKKVKKPKKDKKSKIIKPPFRIVQLGQPRTGSTFQYILLQAIAYLKSPSDIEVETLFTKDVRDISKAISQKKSFVIKTHKESAVLERLKNRGEINVFTSGSRNISSTYNQDLANLVKCSICEVDQYQRFFDLTDDDIENLKKYMSLYEKIRKCCGLQMSKYQVQRLNGCDVSMYVDKPDYPNCENENMTDIELQFSDMSIPYHAASPDKDWSKPGDCAAFDSIIASGKALNGKNFKGCFGEKGRKNKHKKESI